MKNTNMADAIYTEAGKTFVDVYDNLYDIELRYAVQDNEDDKPFEELQEQVDTDLRKAIGNVLTILRDNPDYLYEIESLFTKLEEERIAEEIKEIDVDILVNAR